MHGIRRAFLLLVVVLAVPLTLLLREVFATAAEEQAQARLTVAERLVDSLEQQLNTWLAGEEDRPYGHYRYLFLPDSASESEALERSPLAGPPDVPFVLGYFQVEPDGTVTSPRWPEDEALARRLAGFEPDPRLQGLLGELGAVLAELFRAPTGLPASDDSFPAVELADDSNYRIAGPSQMAGTTVPIDPRGQALLAKKEAFADRQETDDGGAQDDSALDVLEQLNRAAYDRSQRPGKQSQTQLQNVANFTLEPIEPELLEFESPASADGRSRAPSSRSEADETRVAQEVTQELTVSTDEALALPPSPAPPGTSRYGSRSLDDRAHLEVGAAAGDPLDAVEVRYEPMVGRDLGEGWLVLYRTVVLGQRAYRQGLLVDTEALLSWLGDRTLAGTEARQTVRLLPDGASPQIPADGHAFRYRFAEPFAGLTAVLAIGPLANPGGRQLTTLAVLLTVALILALAALYRMVAVVVGFSERRNNFVSAVSHELKTPLTAIRMHGEMLRDGMVASDDHRQRYYEVLTSEAERLTRLVNNVLELSRLERRDRPMNLVAGPVAPVLDEVSRLLGPHVEKQGFVLRTEVEDGLPEVRFDRDALVQVLFNLIDNALKYARDTRSKEIVLRAGRQGEGLTLAIQDHGPGVERRHLEKIFEPFYRGESELTRRAKGTGIGLALVRGLVERMGGTVSGRNRPEGGFEVAVALPASA